MMEPIVEWLLSDLGIKVMMTLVIVVFLLQIPPIMVWVERRGSALMQNRLGPNRVGPLGLLQSLADAVKFIFKEDKPTENVDKVYWFLAPLISVIPAFMTFAVVPFASSIELPSGQVITFQLAELNVGFLYVFAIASLGVYGIIMGAWASNSKYSLFGGLRSSAQMISYELSLGLSVIGIVMVFSSVELGEIASKQGQALIELGPLSIPSWGILVQPLGGLIFIIAIFAETNRLPFDLPEGESEIVAGYHLEYGALKFALFMLAEYVNMFTAAGLITTLYFGGWQMLPGLPLLLESLPISGMTYEWVRVLFEHISFMTKILFFMWFFVWVRWTLPRFRYDQVMDLGWRVMLPLSLANIALTGALIYFEVI